MNMIQENIENLKNKIKELKNHPCCLDYEFDSYGRLTVILPLGYKYNTIAQGFRVNEGTKVKNIKKALVLCEEVWNNSFECFNL